MDLKKIRKVLGLTQKELAKKLKMSQSQISAIEQGQRRINDRLIMQISLVFGLSEEWIRTGEGDPYPEWKREDDNMHKDEFIKRFEKAYNAMNQEEKETLESFMYKFGIISKDEDDIFYEADYKKIM